MPRRILISRPGGYDRLTLAPFAPRAPGPGEARVAVRYTGVNYADCIVRMGLYAPARRYVGYPICPGFDFAGEVEALGEGVGEGVGEGLAIGQAVIGVSRFDAYADRVTVPAHQLFPLPEGLDLAGGAAFPTAHLTAWYALREAARVRPGERVLVHSASGGVGSAALAIGRALGCPTVGVVRGAHKRALAGAAGASAVIDKGTEALWPAAERASPGGFDAILDANGAETLKESYAHLAPGGRLILYGFHSMLPRSREGSAGWPDPLRLALGWLRTPRFDPLAMTGDNRGVHGFNLAYMLERAPLLRAAMEELFGWLREGAIPAPEVHVHPAEEVAEAHRALESGLTTGKLVLRW